MEREQEPELGAPKRPLLDSLCSGRAAKRPAQQQKHLYVLVDDWERGYSICKVGEEDDQPPLPLVRIEAEHGRSWFLVAHGSKIMAIWPPSESSPGIPVFDTETMGDGGVA